MELVVDIGKKYRQITGPLSDSFAKEITDIITTGDFDELVLDFKGTEILSSMAMGTLFAAYKKLKEQDKNMRLVNVSDKVIHLLRMVNMAELLT